jgi:subfamily B ATP-binding cassette protein MsbA
MLSKITEFFEKRPEADGTYNVGYLYKRLYDYFRPYALRALLATFITIPIGALDGAVAYSLKPYVDAMQVKTSIQTVSYVPFIIVGFTLVQGLLNYLSIYLNGWLGGRIMNDLRQDLFAKLQTLDVSYFDKTSSGAVIQSYFQDPQAVNTNILNNTKQMLTRLSSALFLMGVLINTSWKLSIIAIGILGLVLYPSTQIRKIIKGLARNAQSVTGNILSFYTETVSGIRVIYGFNLPQERQKKFAEYQRNLFKTMIKYTQAQGWLTPSMHVIASVGIAVIIWQGSLMVVRQELTTGGFVSFIAAMLMLYNPMKNLGGSIMTAQMSLLAAGRIFQTLEQIPTIVDKPDAKELQGIREGIAFENVSFTYNYSPNDDSRVLKNISMTFEKGETIALVGGSGGGKSTIASLIPRFYDVTEGAIRIDGIDIRDYSLHSLRAHIASVTQDNFLFDGTIRENLLMGDPKATDAELWNAVDKAYLKEFVESLPAQLETTIGERGVLLSGGQRQRLAIARAILKNAPIVILDEATSALDSQSEVIVQKAMESLMADRTVLVIAHRLSTIRNADRIVVLDQGEIVEEGTHDVLLARNGLYARLYHTQYSHQQDGLPTVFS